MDDDQRAQLAAAIDKIANLLATIQAADREPDAWEADHVARALGYALTGWVFAAHKAADNAAVPADLTDGDRTRAADTPTLVVLRHHLDLVRSMKR